jgi:hypothetical protein
MYQSNPTTLSYPNFSLAEIDEFLEKYHVLTLAIEINHRIKHI